MHRLRPTFCVICLFILFGCAHHIQAQQFRDVSEAAGLMHFHHDTTLMGGGGAFLDYNNDGYLDIYLVGGHDRDKLFKNNGDKTFTEVGESVGIGITANPKTVGVACGDIDNDGWQDIFVTTNEQSPNILLKNNNGSFSNIASAAGVNGMHWSTSAGFADYNNDGYIDLYVCNYVYYSEIPFNKNRDSGRANYFYVNNGDGTFTDMAASLNIDDKGAGLAVAFFDIDNDHDLDLYVGNDYGWDYGANRLYINNHPANTFTDISSASGTDAEISTMGIAPGDYDNDLDLDFYVTDMLENVLYRNDLTDSCAEVADSFGLRHIGGISWGDVMFDYDNNADMDIFVATGGVLPVQKVKSEPNKLFSNYLNEGFAPTPDTAFSNHLNVSRGVAYGDYDNDGDLDLLVIGAGKFMSDSARTYLYENIDQNNNRYLTLSLTGTQSNRNAVGARVKIVSAGKSFIREVDGGSSYLSANSQKVHFGLGQMNLVDSVIIIWPSGLVQVATNVMANSSMEVVEGNAVGIKDLAEIDSEWQLYPNPASEHIRISGFSATSIASIEIYDVQGKRHKQLIDMNSQLKLDVSNLSAGMYTLRVYFNDGRFAQKKLLKY